MFIVWGSGHFKLNKEPLLVSLDDSITEGEAAEKLPINVFQKYFSLFWIPFFPMGKLVGFKKGSDIFSIKEENLPPRERDAVANFKAQHRTPIYSFAGVILVLVLVIGSWVMDQMDGGEAGGTAAFTYSMSEAYTPRVGDMFVLKTIDEETGDRTYFIGKLMAAEADSFLTRIGSDFIYVQTRNGVEVGQSSDEPTGREIKDYFEKEVLTDSTLFSDSNEDAINMYFTAEELNTQRTEGKLVYVYRK